MRSVVVAHAGEPSQLHTLVDTAFGAGLGLAVVLAYYLFLKFVVSPARSRWSGRRES